MNDLSLLTSSPRRTRHGNTIAAMRTLFDYGAQSRAELARHLGLNRSSSGHIVSELVANDLVREVTKDPRRHETQLKAGRPGIRLELVPEAASFVGVEIGVEHIATLQIDLGARIARRRVEPFEGRTVPVEDAIGIAVGQALDGLSTEELDKLEGLGLAAPGQMGESGFVRVAPMLGWRDTDLQSLARDALALDIPVLVENEANAFAFGESYLDPSSRAGVTLFLVLETGVGGGILIDGKLFRGGHGLAGEIGHMRAAEGVEFEEVLGLDHLLRRHGGTAQGGTRSLAAFLKDVREREPTAVATAEEWSRHLAQAVVQACRLIDPNRVVLGGSVAALYPMVAARVAHHLNIHQAATLPMPEIIVHDAPETGAAFGAACMLHRRFMSLDNQPVAHASAEG